MTKLMTTQLKQSGYCEIVTVLDYEIRLNSYLEELQFPPSDQTEPRKILVDMALKSGIDKFRFVEFIVNAAGKVLLNTNKYIIPSCDIENEANNILKSNKDAVRNSVLPDFRKEELCTGC